jgi:hypothetical protein
MLYSANSAGKLGVLTKNSTALGIYSIMNNNTGSKADTASSQQQQQYDANELISMQLVVDRKSTIKSPLKTQASSESSTASRATVVSTSGSDQQLTHFCWIDSNKVIVATNSQRRCISTVSLFDSFALCWSPDGDLFWSSNSVKVHTSSEKLGDSRSVELHSPTRVHKANSDSYNFLGDFKTRTRADYGLRVKLKQFRYHVYCGQVLKIGGFLCNRFFVSIN